ncbi:MAG: sulfatase [Bacteroidales bacterium]|nr:sulfatase [Bacteroidales bacterium]
MNKKNIDRRNFIRQAGIGSLAIGITLPANKNVHVTYKDTPVEKSIGSDNMVFNRPNIVYLHSHDTGRYIQPYGYPVPTPNLQKLAEEGVLFKKYFTTHPTSSASRASLLTGMYPHNNGMIGLAHRGFVMKDPHTHINFTLKKYGYYSALSGVQHEVAVKNKDFYKEIGYDEFLGNPKEAHLKAVEWLDKAHSNPFFLSVGFTETHREYAKHKSDINPDHLIPPKPLPDVPEVREDMADFMESARILDEKMGTVLAALRRNGLEDNTIVICTTDHGIAFPSMKCNLYDEGIGIFMIMRLPGGLSAGKTINSMVSVIDIFPTICEFLEIEKPAWLDGTSVMPLIRGEKQEIREDIFCQVNYHAAYEPMRAIRTKRYKYIRRFGDKANPVIPNCDDSPSKQYWLDNGWKDVKLSKEELYDLVFDPNERNNLIKDPLKQKVLKKMRASLHQTMEKTGDPLINGYIVAPPDAILNDPDDLSPKDKTFKASELYKFNQKK